VRRTPCVAAGRHGLSEVAEVAEVAKSWDYAPGIRAKKIRGESLRPLLERISGSDEPLSG